ncbi:MAG: hypothetical protein AMXMBFR47_09730 [Planctomycetota bacterium]
MRCFGPYLLAPVSAMTVATAALASDWTHYARDSARRAIADAAPPALTAAWIAQPAADEEFIVNSTPVATGGRVFHLARWYDGAGEHAGNRVIAFAAATGSRLWTADVVADQLSSWSSPAIDVRNGWVIVGSGAALTALAAADGSVEWAAALPEPVVNASPVVTGDLSSNGAAANRVFITGFSPSPGSAATLSAINVDAFEEAGNPFVPGELAWSVSINGLTGASPAYAEGVVFVASTSGIIRALDAASGGLVWETPIANQGFFGGVTVNGGYVYAASYRFTFGQNNSRLVKLRAGDGALIWSTPCERSATVPVVTSNGLIVLSGGIDDAGSAVKVQAWQDDGTTVTPLWDTYAASGGGLWLGGWTSQPVVAENEAFIGVPASDAFSPMVRLVRLDLTRGPADPGFVAEAAEGAGGSVAAADGALFSYGVGGLYCFRSPAGRIPELTESAGAIRAAGVRRW